MLASLGLACSPSVPASAGDSVLGSARDADTDEPIAGAWIFETLKKPGAVSDVLHVARFRVTRSDAHGRFEFEAAPVRFGFGRRYPPDYQFYHPSYGLVRARADTKGRVVTLRPSLRDAHLRQADATPFCGSSEQDAMTLKMIELACPPSRANRFAGGAARATGAFDERGRRDGEWTFFREDGTVIAHGKYRAGAAVGSWYFEAPNGPPQHPD